MGSLLFTTEKTSYRDRAKIFMALGSGRESMPESRVLIIMTGGTICMKYGDHGLIPAQGFLESGMAPRPSFNDGSNPDDIAVMVDENTAKPHRSLRTPISRYEKHIRYTVYEFEELLDSSSINSNGWSQISSSIYRNYSRYDAFVILHGTVSNLHIRFPLHTVTPLLQAWAAEVNKKSVNDAGILIRIPYRTVLHIHVRH
jgi:L-asparaginase/Glu-tRNA(Gln) amidotransferase subunit D